MQKLRLGLICALASLLLVTFVLNGCNKKDEAPPPAAKPAPPPPPPPPPPDTSLGKLTRVERTAEIDIQVLCENSRGLSFIASGPVDPTLGKKGQFKAKPGQEVFTSGFDTMCPATEKETAAAPSTLLVLHFEGDPQRTQRGEVVPWVVAPQSHYLTRADDKSWLTDAASKQYKKPFFLSTKAKRYLAFVIPADAAGLIWHDGKKLAFNLEPAVTAVAEPAPAAAEPPKKAQ